MRMGCVEHGNMKVEKKERKVMTGKNKTVIACTLAPCPHTQSIHLFTYKNQGVSDMAEFGGKSDSLS